MPEWRPDQYLMFERERTRPCRDLLAQIQLGDAGTIIDLGCGPGNSTAVLAARWPSARITGLDNSREMLERARRTYPGQEWVEGEIAAWSESDGPRYDLVFSNAALHWVENHGAVYPRLLSRVTEGGALAIQVPANLDSPAHQAMREVAASRAWRGRFPEGGVRQWFVHEAGFYYDILAPAATRIDLWETTYLQVMDSAEAIVEWYKSTGLRPFLDALPTEADREEFIRDYTEAVRGEYATRPDGRVLFPFRRMFLIAER